MKSSKNIIVSILSIVLVIFAALSFLINNDSESVKVKAVEGSYAQTFAENEKLEFVAIPDSENPDVEIPKQEADKEQETTAAPQKTTPNFKDNGEFEYNYEGNTVKILKYIGNNKSVVVPKEIDSWPVTALALDPIEENIDEIEIPDTVKSIEGEYKTARYNAEFFVGLAIVLVGYVYAIFVTLLAFKKANTNEKTFYGIPLAYNGFTAFIITAVVSGLAMLFDFSIIFSVVITALIIGISAVGLVKTNAARDIVEETGEKVKAKTAFIKSLTVDANALVNSAKSADVKAECKKVYEAIRYSDPMTAPEIMDIESRIADTFNQFSNAVYADDADSVKQISTDLQNLISQRNSKCKLFK